MSQPLDLLLARLAGEAEAQGAALLAQARADAERTLAEATAAAEQLRSERLAERSAQLRAALARRLEQTKRQGRHQFLEVRAAAVERVLARLGELLPEASRDPRYLRDAEAELDDALSVLDGGPATLRASPELAERVAARAERGLEIHADHSVTGFLLRGDEGRVVVDGRLEARLRRMAPRLAIAAARALEREP